MTNQLELIERLTKQAVHEVWESMLSMELNYETPAQPIDDTAGQIVGSVGFIGKATGVIYLYAGLGFARVATGRMLGLAEGEVEDEMINDAVGELTNMVVGYVKSRLCDDGWTCTLTIPSIVRGQQLRVEGASDISRSILGFRNCEHHLLAEVLLKNSGA